MIYSKLYNKIVYKIHEQKYIEPQQSMQSKQQQLPGLLLQLSRIWDKEYLNNHSNQMNSNNTAYHQSRGKTGHGLKNDLSMHKCMLIIIIMNGMIGAMEMEKSIKSSRDRVLLMGNLLTSTSNLSSPCHPRSFTARSFGTSCGGGEELYLQP